jgi:hypothetical protein
MNGGQVATRGFLLQTLVALLDTLDSLAQIKSLRLEPSTDEDKTDFVLEYTNGRKKAVQVKSSQNQIGLPAVKRWAKKLKGDIVADEYELVLIGPCSGELTKAREVDGVKLPVPKSLDVKGMLEQASHRLDVYLHRGGMTCTSPKLRELLVEGLIGKLSTYSTGGTPLSSSEFVKVFQEWKNAAEEQALREIEKRYGDGTLTDIDALKEYSAQFDRAALQDSLRGCWSYKRFAESLGELIELLNTGSVQGKRVTKRRANFTNRKWRDSLAGVYHEVRGLRELYATLVRSGEIDEATCGCKCQDHVLCDFEERKRKIVSLLNEILRDAGLPTIRGLP